MFSFINYISHNSVVNESGFPCSNHSLVDKHKSTDSQFATKMNFLKKTKATQSLGITSMPCEERAAAIRNKAVNSIENNDVADVAYRFLQSRQGRNNTFKEAVFWTGFAAIMFVKVSGPKSPAPLKYKFLAMHPILHVPPNINNFFSYRETKKGCEEFLICNLGKSAFEEIKNFEFNQDGMIKLIDFFDRENLSSVSLSGRENKKDKKLACWDMSVE